MREQKKDLLTKYILIKNYSSYVYGQLRKEDTLDELSSNGEYDKMLRKFSISDLKNKLKCCLDISRKGDLAQRHPSLLNVLDRIDGNKDWKENNIKEQYNILSEKINKAIAKIMPLNRYKVGNINLYDKTIRVELVELGWRSFKIQCYGSKGEDCSIEVPSMLIHLHSDTNNADQSARQMTDFSETDNKSILRVMSGVAYLYNNKYILEDICQAFHDYEMEKERINAIYEDNNDEITDDGIAILENAARKAYFDGELVV